MFPYMTHIIIIFRPFTFPWPIVCILCVRLNEGVCCYTQDDPISNYRGCKYFCQWFRLELWQTVKHVHIVSYLDLDMERSRQTPDMGITSTNGDGELVQTTLEAVDAYRFGGFFVKFVPLGNCSGVERFLVCGCGRRDALELVLVVASAALIHWDKRRSWYCSKTMDNFEHGG